MTTEEREAAGRRRRGLLLIAAALAVVAPTAVLTRIADVRADSAAEQLRGDLLAATEDLTPEQVEQAWADHVTGMWAAEEPRQATEVDATLRSALFPGVDALLVAASFESGTLHAAFGTGWWLEDRCVRVVFGRGEHEARIADGACAG